jgi:SAM-dependent methyltransferase
VKLDIGCGPNPREGFEGVDQYAFDGKVKHVLDVRKTPWPWADGSVEEVHCSHFLEHLTGVERVAFANECYRVLKPGGAITIIVPHWASNRAYGDPTHQWPPVSEMWFYYLSREWRKANAPHTDKANWAAGFDCDYDATWGYSMRQDLLVRNQEYQQYAITNFKEAAQDLMATLKKK